MSVRTVDSKRASLDMVRLRIEEEQRYRNIRRGSESPSAIRRRIELGASSAGGSQESSLNSSKAPRTAATGLLTDTEA